MPYPSFERLWRFIARDSYAFSRWQWRSHAHRGIAGKDDRPGLQPPTRVQNVVMVLELDMMAVLSEAAWCMNSARWPTMLSWPSSWLPVPWRRWWTHSGPEIPPLAYPGKFTQQSLISWRAHIQGRPIQRHCLGLYSEAYQELAPRLVQNIFPHTSLSHGLVLHFQADPCLPFPLTMFVCCSPTG